MGIQVEFNPDLCLRPYTEYTAGRRKKEECVPETLHPGERHAFLKKDQRLFWLDGELPLRTTAGNGVLSRPLASIIIEEATHCKMHNERWTKGWYRIIEVYTDTAIHFDGLEKI
ncbi:MAG TPA: hypothetical protein VEA18_02620 [Candidatus Kapabacteria bacterium]|nr:hypothetical protein [Candidatus Kapabacteria bacterium]